MIVDGGRDSEEEEDETFMVEETAAPQEPEQVSELGSLVHLLWNHLRLRGIRFCLHFHKDLGIKSFFKRQCLCYSTIWKSFRNVLILLWFHSIDDRI